MRTELHPKRGKRVGFIYRWRTDHKTTRHTWRRYLEGHCRLIQVREGPPPPPPHTHE